MLQASRLMPGSESPGILIWDSPYFVPEPDNWHLTEDAPDDLKKEFEKYMRETDESTVK